MVAPDVGLSPPTRGIRQASGNVVTYVWSIPAYAGDPPLSGRSAGLSRVYPRLRGGSRAARLGGLRLRGLSPPTRGIPATRLSPLTLTRSIPAYAGDPPQHSSAPPIAEVYPRLRGGSESRTLRRLLRRGLSPPTRGIRLTQTSSWARRGSIPAYAGDPSDLMSVCIAEPVYPRLRGGSRPPPHSRASARGLSPPTRGIPLLCEQDVGRRGSIPAYAGDP